MIVHSLKSDGDGANEGGVVGHGKKYNKSFGKNLKTEDVHTVPETFFDCLEDGNSVESDSRKGITECTEIMTHKISKIYDAFNEQRKYQIYGSSLLLAYDADAIRCFRSGKIQSKEELSKFVNVKLIDFAHVFPSDGGRRDDNFCRGLANVLSLFQDFLQTK